VRKRVFVQRDDHEGPLPTALDGSSGPPGRNPRPLGLALRHLGRRPVQRGLGGGERLLQVFQRQLVRVEPFRATAEAVPLHLHLADLVHAGLTGARHEGGDGR
jgi:hypothetical protein